MEGSADYFNHPITFKVAIEGEVNMRVFKVVGNGKSFGGGDFNIHAYSDTGRQLPMSWIPLYPFLQSFPMFTKYPYGVVNFFQECFPEGYTVDGTLEFEGEDGGKFTSHQEYTLGGSSIGAKVQLKGEGFKGDSATMTNKYEKLLPATFKNEVVDDCLKVTCRLEMVRKDGGSDFADMTSLYKPKGIRQMSMPPTHMTKQSVATLKDTSEKRDHIVQRVNAVYHQE